MADEPGRGRPSEATAAVAGTSTKTPHNRLMTRRRRDIAGPPVLPQHSGPSSPKCSLPSPSWSTVVGSRVVGLADVPPGAVHAPVVDDDVNVAVDDGRVQHFVYGAVGVPLAAPRARHQTRARP